MPRAFSKAGIAQDQIRAAWLDVEFSEMQSEADSTTGICRSDSLETILIEGICCEVCLLGPQEGGSRLESFVNTTRTFFLSNSTVYLVCRDCRRVEHLHCHLNRTDLDIDDILTVIEQLPFLCQQCVSNNN